MRFKHLPLFLSSAVLAVGCAEPPPPPSVGDYVANKILLDAALAKCGQDRARLKYTQECVNAREASNRIAKLEEEQRSEVLEAQSERKRAALRRAQMAAAEARRRADEAARMREEAAYLAQFGSGAEAAPDAVLPNVDTPETETPEADVPETIMEAVEDKAVASDAETAVRSPQLPGAAFSGTSIGGDLKSIREELERRQQRPE